MATKLKAELPQNLSYQELKLPAYQPINYGQSAQDMLPVMSQYADANIGKQVKAQGDLTRNAWSLTKEIAPQQAQLRADLNEQYMPIYTGQYLDAVDQSDPTFRAVRDRLGARVATDLDAGYSLGDELTREVEQGVRGSQSARGNWLGPAPTAAEVFRKGSAMIDLNNQRQSNARGFLQSRSASDMFGNFSSLEGYQPVGIITPQNDYINSNAPAQMAIAEAGNLNDYNRSLISAYGVNQDAAFGNYDRQWDRYLYSSFDYSPQEVKPQKKNWIERMMQGAQTGAQDGSVAGPWGAIGGAAGGAVDGAANGPIYKARLGDSGQYK